MAKIKDKANKPKPFLYRFFHYYFRTFDTPVVCFRLTVALVMGLICQILGIFMEYQSIDVPISTAIRLMDGTSFIIFVLVYYTLLKVIKYGDFFSKFKDKRELFPTPMEAGIDLDSMYFLHDNKGHTMILNEKILESLKQEFGEEKFEVHEKTVSSVEELERLFGEDILNEK